ncbi:hypothetical protein AZE42_14186, partial [Rhizopogon vesiculosus]
MARLQVTTLPRRSWLLVPGSSSTAWSKRRVWTTLTSRRRNTTVGIRDIAYHTQV